MSDYQVGDTVKFRYLKKEDSEGKALIKAIEMGNIFVSEILEHPSFRKNCTIKLLLNELVEKV